MYGSYFIVFFFLFSLFVIVWKSFGVWFRISAINWSEERPLKITYFMFAFGEIDIKTSMIILRVRLKVNIASVFKPGL